MDNNVVNVNLVGGEAGIDWVTAISLTFSTISFAISIFYFYRKMRNDRFNILLTPEKKVYSHDILFLYLAIENRSAQPITFSDFKIEHNQLKNIEDLTGTIVGSTLFTKNEVEGCLIDEASNEHFMKYNLQNELMPISFSAYEAKGFFVAFHLPNSAKKYSQLDLTLLVNTSRKNFKMKVSLGSSNFSDTSHNGYEEVGEAVTRSSLRTKFKHYFGIY